MTPAIAATALYAGLNAFVLIGLAIQTGRIRQRTGVTMGDGGEARLIRVMRGHANAIETIPVALLLLLLVALLGAPAWAIHVLGALLTIGRVLHALHFGAADAPAWQRGAGAGTALLVLLVGGLWAVVAGIGAAF